MPNLDAPWPVASARAAFAATLALFVLLAALQLADRSVHLWATALPAPLPQVMKWITRWGESDWQLIPALLLLIVTSIGLRVERRDNWRAGLRELRVLAGFVFVGVGLPSLTSSLLKRAIGRARPSAWTDEAPVSFIPNLTLYDHQSFPSGHATTAFAMAWVVAFLWPRAFWPAMLVGATIAVSRVFTGSHYLTDVIAGAALGTLGAYAVRWYFARRGWLFELSSDGHIRRKPFDVLRLSRR